MKRILEREQFIRRKNLEQIQRIDEVLANEINWGDSLVGRMINSFIRKGQIGWNLRKIGDKKKGLIGQLNNQFQIIKDSMQLGLSADDQRFLETMSLLQRLEKMIELESDVDDIVSHIDNMIYQISTYNLKDSDIMTKALEDFKAYLLGLKGEDEEGTTTEDDEEELVEIGIEKYFENLKLLGKIISGIGKVSLEGQNEEERVEEEGEEESEDKPKVDKDKIKHPNFVIYKRKDGKIGKGVIAPTPIIKNPDTGKEMVQVMSNPEKVINEQKSYGIPLDDIVKVMPPIKKGSIIGFKKDDKAYKGKVQGISGGDLQSKVLTIELTNGKIVKLPLLHEFTILGKEDIKNQKSEQSEKPKVRTEVQDTNEGFLFESEVSGEDSQSSQALVNLRKSVKFLTNKKDKGLAVDVDLISSIIKYENEEDIQEMVRKLYVLVWSFLFGKRKQTLNPNTKPIFENFIEEYRIDVKNGYGIGKLEVLAQKIARFSYKCLQFDNNENPLSLKKENENITAPYGDFGKVIDAFNSSLKEILIYTGKSEKVKEKAKEEKVEEKVIYDYDKFRLFEATSGVDYSEVRSKFDEIFNPRVKPMFDLNKETVERLKNLQNTGRLVLRTPDPIIQIVNIFHRAWRLHTPGVIPSGRTGGKVSNSVFREYEYMGEGSGGTPESPGSGPYRNIKLWDAWREGVSDILSDTEYRNTIFSDKCEFMFEDTREKPGGNEPKSKDNLGDKVVNEADAVQVQTQAQGQQPKSGETTKRPLGKILLRFINRLLADTKMYKKGGALPAFFNEYFDLDDKYLSAELSKMPGAKDDIKKNQETVEAIAVVDTFFRDYGKEVKIYKEDSNIFGYLRDNKEKPPIGLTFRLKNKDGEWNYFQLKKKYNGSLFFLYTKNFAFQLNGVTVSEPNGNEMSSSNSEYYVSMYFGEGKFGVIGLEAGEKSGKIEMDNSSVQVLTKKDGSTFTKLKPALKANKFKEVYMDKLLEMSGKAL